MRMCLCVCVCVCECAAFLRVPLGDVFISFDLMTANGKSIKQNAPPSFRRQRFLLDKWIM